MTSTGYNVMGWQVDPTDPTAIKADVVTPLRIMTDANMTYPPAATTAARVSGIIDRNDTNVTGDGRILNLEFYDNQGYKYTARMTVSSTAEDAEAGIFTVKLADILDVNGKSVLTNEDGTPKDGVSASILAADGTTDLTAGATLTFNTKNGAFTNIGDGNTAVGDNLILSFEGLPSFDQISIDFSNTSNVSNNKASTIAPYRGDSKGNGAGRMVGKMSGIEIQKDGMIYAKESKRVSA